jgi:putative transposase
MNESEFIHKSHNVTVLIYHLVCPVKYRKLVLDDAIDIRLKEICLEIEKRYEIRFLEIGLDGDHAHFLIQSVPSYSVSDLVRAIKSITAREMFKSYPDLRKRLWGSQFWSSGYFMSTVGKHGDEKKLREYVQKQGNVKNYNCLHQSQLKLF